MCWVGSVARHEQGPGWGLRRNIRNSRTTAGLPPPCSISSLSSQKVTTYDLGGCSTARMPRSPASAASRMPHLVTCPHLRQHQRQGRQLAWLTPREATLGEARKNAQRRDLLGALALHLRSSSSTSPASRGDSRSIVSFNGAR